MFRKYPLEYFNSENNVTTRWLIARNKIISIRNKLLSFILAHESFAVS